MNRRTLLCGVPLLDITPEDTSVLMTATAYCLYGHTAWGLPTRSGIVAAGPSVPFGTQLYIQDYGYAIVADRGPAIKDGMLDVWFPTCQQAIQWGRKAVKVWFL